MKEIIRIINNAIDAVSKIEERKCIACGKNILKSSTYWRCSICCKALCSILCFKKHSKECYKESEELKRFTAEEMAYGSFMAFYLKTIRDYLKSIPTDVIIEELKNRFCEINVSPGRKIEKIYTIEVREKEKNGRFAKLEME
jgi:hypothetical protein